MAYEIGYYDAVPYAAPEPDEAVHDDPLAEPDWTPAAVALASLVVALCCAAVALVI